MLTVNDLTYTYPGAPRQTLHGLNFSIAEGAVFGFLGPSGAGKSTTQRILIRLLRGYEGSVQVLGRELSAWGQEYYRAIGVAFELPNHFLKLTARENLVYFRALYAGETRDPLEVLTAVNLDDDADKPVSAFSKGMKIRLNVARALLHRPRILFLDEPTAGLDPVNARTIKDLILAERARGTTVFITTHDMQIADSVCDQVAFLSAGAICVIDAPDTLKKRYGQRRVAVAYRGDDGAIAERHFALDGLGADAGFAALLRDTPIESIHSQETTLEDIFIRMTGEALST